MSNYYQHKLKGSRVFYAKLISVAAASKIVLMLSENNHFDQAVREA